MSILITSGGVVTLGGGVPRRATGATIVAESASSAHVQAAVDAASPGDTVSVPAGSATWSSTVTVSKAISIIGQWNGSSGTVLTWGGGGLSTDRFFYVTNVTASQLLRISGIRFVGSGAAPYYAINVENNVSLSSLRIDHNRFDEGKVAIQATGSKGVIDHNEFYNGESALSFSAGSVAQANASWESMAAGTADALFFEDNTIVDNADYPLAYAQEKIGTNNGGKIVVRHNEFDFDDCPLDAIFTPFMAHGSAKGGASGSGYWQEGTGARRGQSVIEFYENIAHGPRIDFLYTSRGSANLVWNNEITGTVTNAPRIYFYEEEQYESSNWSPLRTAWPAEDQVHNSFIWGNKYNGSAYFNDAGHIAIGATSGDYIQINREFFLHEPAATGGKASFTGMNGGTNTYPTNGDTLPTLGAMTFSAEGPSEYYGYVPYTYPHPLTA